ncbi:hypothetical protein PsorP6_002889 [Peronosclerospora sorghi]|uniref:Uncharacterized protein n=1 Tax=Peronosclerospora sorghi TaxID=230839 RepID=A0ACC0VSN7_9STRA|nr:hypothetical protein PsorP6_002889 [Peronosclerospora sorghi]
METPSVRILVLGDSGVGKTTLLRSICRAESLVSTKSEKPSALWTTGCDVHVLFKSLEFAGQREVFVEFLDVGGHRQYERSRHAFYYDVHGVILVHDLSNSKSREHLRNWSKELSTIQKIKGCVVPSMGNERGASSLTDLPKLVVGTKKDVSKSSSQKRTRPVEWSEFRTLPCIVASAEPFSMEPRGVFDTFLHQALTFATRGSDGTSYKSYNKSRGLRASFRSVDADDTRVGHGAGYNSYTTALPPLSTGSGSARSRWS